MLKRSFCLLTCLFSFLYSNNQDIEKLLDSMSLDEKIGQLFIIPASPRLGEKHKIDLIHLINKYHIGGVILKSGTINEQVELINYIKKKSKTKIPLFITQDAEWGLGMRSVDGMSFPKNLTLGAIEDDSLIYELGKEIGYQCKEMGYHINFAPVVDINSNPNNPRIHMRSYGGDRENVLKKASFFIKGMTSENVLACIKHFPGHGDTDIDSHFGMPVINKEISDLENNEIYPFKKLINMGVDCVMSAHILFSKQSILPCTFSKFFITDLLREKLNFDGLIITDALNMRALANTFCAKKIALNAHMAGNDILLYGEHISEEVERIFSYFLPGGFGQLKESYIKKEIKQEKLNRHVKRILLAKKKANVFMDRISKANADVLNSNRASKLKKALFSNAITEIENRNNILPINDFKNVTYLQIGSNRDDYFYKKIKKSVNKSYLFSLDAKKDDFENLEINASKIILILYPTSAVQDDFGLKKDVIDFIESLSIKSDVVIFIFGSPYCLKFIKGQGDVVMCYEDDICAKRCAFDVLTKKSALKGKLPILTPYITR
jgi:beta-N-acetylhexosaminidase